MSIFCEYISSLKLPVRTLMTRLYSQKQNSQKWKSVVGLEVHAQISSKSKLFSEASTTFSSPVNTNVSLFDCAIPGTLPVLNKRCVEAGVLAALAFDCKINPVSMFDRKHYFYADLPAGYQITQQRAPLANNGYLEFQVFTPGYHKFPYKCKVGIKQLQLEQDSGKSLHDIDRTLIDLNRVGVPLIEFVFDPDLSDGEEAAALIKELISILQRIDICSCKMEEGALRVDANVSIHQKGEPLGIRTEIKNIGSVRGVANAIRYEIERQIKIKQTGGIILNETRAWDALKKITVEMRDKEVQQDYRYMPEPNLPPLHLAIDLITQGCVNVQQLKESFPELPEKTRQRLQSEFGLSQEQAIILVNDYDLFLLFENTAKKRKVGGKMLANVLINEFTGLLHKANKNIDEIDVDEDYIGEVIELIQEEKINKTTAKFLLNEIIAGNKKRPITIVEEKNLFQITDENELKRLCQEVLDENVKIVQKYKNGKTKVYAALLGLIDKKSNHRANMPKCDLILRDLLNK